MSRQVVRDMKRKIVAGGKPAAAEPTRLLAHESALALLDRSIRFGPRRLAVVRLTTAVLAGAEVTAEHWVYCWQAADRSKDAQLQSLLRAATAACRGWPRQKTSTPA